LKTFIGSARNISLMPTMDSDPIQGVGYTGLESGFVPVIEAVLMTAEPRYVPAASGRVVKALDNETHRIHLSLESCLQLSVRLTDWIHEALNLYADVSPADAARYQRELMAMHKKYTQREQPEPEAPAAPPTGESKPPEPTPRPPRRKKKAG
jgi:hypothetical protein